MSKAIAEISSLLDNDMQAVNAIIRDRMQSQIPLIPKLAEHLISAGGKRIRPLMTLACTAIYSGEMPRAHTLAAAVEFIHSATLLHDDVVDESNERRGKTTANLIYGNQPAILVGDFLFARAFQLMTEENSIEILRILSNASATIAEGEVKQLAHKGDMNTTMEDYTTIIKAKTAALFAAATEVAPVIAGADKNAQTAMHDYGLNLGIAFQIADDALDYAANGNKLGKEIGDDFREGKLTAPILLAMKNATAEEQDFWKRTLSYNEQTGDDLQTALDILNRHNAVENSLALADKYGAKAITAMQSAPDHALKDHMIELVNYAIRRET